MTKPDASASAERREAADTSPRAWQRMLSGHRLDLLNPDPAHISLTDIAHGLARVARWNGQTIGEHSFSVAQHSLLVLDIANDINPDLDKKWQRATLLHDAPEYVIGDLISPFKAMIGTDYKACEKRLLDAIHLAFNLPTPLPEGVTALIKQADRIAAYHEATKLAGFSIDEANTVFERPPALSDRLVKICANLSGAPATEGQAAFAQRVQSLS